jgi:PAS domain S-box-containing protein
MVLQRNGLPHAHAPEERGVGPLRTIEEARWIPLVLAIAGLSASILLWRTLVNLERSQLAVLSEAQARSASNELQRGFQTVTQAVAGMAQRYAGALSQGGSFHLEITALEATAWADPSGKIRTVDAPDGKLGLADADLSAREVDRPAFLKARASGQPAATRSIVLPGGEPGFHLIVPTSEGGQRVGFLVAVFSERKVESIVLEHDLAPGWDLAVYEGDQELYRRGSPVGGRWVAESTFKIADVERHLRASPGPEVIARVHGPVPALVLATGSIISLLLAGSVGLAQGARRRAREAEAAYRALQKSEEARTRLAAIVNSSHDAIVGETLDGLITSWNKGAERIFGFAAEEAIGRPITMLMPPDHADEAPQTVGRLKRGELIEHFQTVHRRKDGQDVDVSITISPIRDSAGEVVGASKIARDISQEKRLEELRRRSIEVEAHSRQVQEANRLKSEFLANMSHELRTPLNAIIGFSELMHDEKVGPVLPEQKEYLGDILTSSHHLLQLINDVLDLSKVEAGKMEFRPEPVEITRLLGEVSDILRTLSAKKRVEIIREVEAGLGGVVVDPAKLKQVLYNYLSNAIKFTPEGGRVTVRASSEDAERFRLEVEDSGIGIRDEDLPRLFTAFQQVDAGASKEYPGTGLGLALTKHIIEAQGGRVGVRSTVGKGSLFFAVLPRIARPSTSVQRRPEAHGSRSERPAILVVEGDTKERAWLINTLSSAGYGVDVAATGREAIERCRERAFDGITLDLLLPDKDGWEVLREVRSGGMNQTTPAIIVTVVAEKDAGAGFAFQDYLVKPVRAEQLLASLERAGAFPDGNRSILVVDDDQQGRKLMEATLQSLGYRSCGAANGEEGLEVASTSSPAAVILDLLMPQMDGFEFLERFKRTPAGRVTPVIVWTAKDLNAQDHSRLAALAQSVVLKRHGGARPLIEELQACLRPQRPSGAPEGAATEFSVQSDAPERIRGQT